MSRPPISSIVGGKRSELVSMPWPEYLEFPALNGSVLVKGRKSMRHLKYAWDNDGEDTDAMRFGRLQHCLLFEPREVESRYRTWEGRRAGKDYEAFCEDAALAGAEVVRAAGEYSMQAALEAAPAFLGNTKVQALISAGQAEQTVLAVESALQCKGRIDWISTAEHVLTDLKTTNDIQERLFGTSFFRYGYDVKLGLYRRWLDRVTGERWPVQVIVLESKPPYDTAVMNVPDAVLDSGVDKALRIIEKVWAAIETDQWPGVAGNEFYPLYVPFYEMDSEETEEFKG